MKSTLLKVIFKLFSNSAPPQNCSQKIRPNFGKPFESDSRAMKIRVKVAYSCLTLPKKPPFLRNSGYAPGKE